MYKDNYQNAAYIRSFNFETNEAMDFNEAVPCGTYHCVKYRIRRGDTGKYIAGKYSIIFESLEKANPWVNWFNLPIGGHLCIPCFYHIIRRGDTGKYIARNYNIKFESLERANQWVVDWSNLPIGGRLSIPCNIV
jgi:hypothetical protein